jgi:dUTPase
MNIIKVNENAEIPETNGSSKFDIKACIKQGQKIIAFNAWNKKIDVIVKGVAGNPNSFQLPPQTRILVPTGLSFDVPKDHAIVTYMLPEVTLKLGLTLANGTQIIFSGDSGEVHVMLINITESLVVIQNDQKLAQCILQKLAKIEIIEKTD